jgi:hypothetical protein
MKSKLLNIIVIIVLIAFFGSCSSSNEAEKDGKDVEETFTGTLTATKSGVTYTLTINPGAARNAIGPAVGDAYALSVKKGDEEQISTGKITLVSSSVLTLQPTNANASPFNIAFTGTRITKVTETITFDDGKTMQGPGSVITTSSGGGGGGGGGGGSGGNLPPLDINLSFNIIIINKPTKIDYKMCEEIDKTGLIVAYVYSNGITVRTDEYYIDGDTFTPGKTSIKVVSKKNTSKTTSFDINVSKELVTTGLPVIYIDTEDEKEINSKTDWFKTKIKVVDHDNPKWDYKSEDYDIKGQYTDDIRGRGNNTWEHPKKPYRIRFKKDTSMFGLEAARNWVLLAEYEVPTLIGNAIAFELVELINGPLIKNHYKYVDVVLNGQYNGTYLLTEHMRVGTGRVEIDEVNDYLVEIDSMFDDDPKFRTDNLQLPVMISSPDFGKNINDSRYNFVKNSLNALDAELVDVKTGNWQNLLDIVSLVDYMLILEITQSYDYYWNRMGNNVFMYKKATENTIKISHVWDFDKTGMVQGAFNAPPFYDGNISHIPFTRYTVDMRMKGGELFGRFHEDTTFKDTYKARWNEKLDAIKTMPDIIEKIAKKIEKSHSLNLRRWNGCDWYHDNIIFKEEVRKQKEWWNERVDFLNTAIND